MIGPGDDVHVSTNPLASAGLVAMSGTGRITFSSDVAMSVGSLSVSAGTVAGAGTLTVLGAFSKDPNGAFDVVNDGFAGKAPDLVLAVSGVLGGGTVCVFRHDSADPDLPNLQIDGTLSRMKLPKSLQRVLRQRKRLAAATHRPRERTWASDPHHRTAVTPRLR